MSAFLRSLMAVSVLSAILGHPTLSAQENPMGEESILPVTVFKLKNAKSSQVAEKIRLILPSEAGPIVSDDRTNSVMIRGDEKLIKEIHRLVDLLDDEVLSKNVDEKIEPPDLVTVNVIASKAAEQHPELKPLLEDLRGLDYPDSAENKSPIAGVLINVPEQFSKKQWIAIITYLLDASGVRVFFVDRRPENKVTELTIYVTPQTDENGKVGLHAESLQPVRTQLEKLPNINVRFVGVTGNVFNMVRFPDDVKDALPQQEVKVFALQHIAALEAQKIIVELFGRNGTTASVEQRTNTIVVRCQPERNAEIEAILMRLDEKPQETPKIASKQKDPIHASSTTHLELSSGSPNAIGSPIEAFRRRLSDLEKPVPELAEKLRSCEATFGKDHRDSVKLRVDLRALMQQSFVARQEIQRAELVEFSRRLQVMQQTIEARDRISEKIVDRRMDELLDPNVEWTQPKKRTPSE